MFDLGFLSRHAEKQWELRGEDATLEIPCHQLADPSLDDVVGFLECWLARPRPEGGGETPEGHFAQRVREALERLEGERRGGSSEEPGEAG